MTPLHRAVIEDDENKLNDPAFIAQWYLAPDRLGFTALEVAQFLGKYRLAHLLGGIMPQSFSLHPNGIKKPITLSLQGFEKALGIRYRPFLTFKSYQNLQETVENCPFLLRSRSLSSDNYQWTSHYYSELTTGKVAPICIQWIDIAIGYGAFATEDIAEGSFIGEYTGVVRRLYRRFPDHNPYCFHYPSKWWSLKYFVVDAMREGNLTRFINHSQSPNLKPLCLVDRRLLHQVLVANRAIKKGEQLTFDYGEDYWIKRKKLEKQFLF